MKTASNNKTITNSAYLLFFALLLAGQNGYTQRTGGITGTIRDTYIINNDHSNHQAVLRLQNDNKASLIKSDNSGLKFNFATTRSTSNYGSTKASLSSSGVFMANKYVVQNGVNGGSTKGIYMWRGTDTNWGIYMGQSGFNKAFNGGNAVAGHNFSSHAIRFRVHRTLSNGFIWENSANEHLMSLNGKSGDMGLKGSLAIGGNLVPNTVLTVDGRTYISENGQTEKGFNDTNHQNYGDYLLWVEKGIVSADFAIAEISDWPDYVFNKNYNLRSLKEVEKNIKENGHLPTMPSAKEVAKNGFTVKDITKRVVKTIEELTLHTIAQEKQIAALMDRLVHLEQMLESKGK